MSGDKTTRSGHITSDPEGSITPIPGPVTPKKKTKGESGLTTTLRVVGYDKDDLNR